MPQPITPPNKASERDAGEYGEGRVPGERDAHHRYQSLGQIGLSSKKSEETPQSVPPPTKRASAMRGSMEGAEYLELLGLSSQKECQMPYPYHPLLKRASAMQGSMEGAAYLVSVKLTRGTSPRPRRE